MIDSKILLSGLPEVLKNRVGAFLCCASFEGRSLSIPNSIKGMPIKMVTVFAAEDCHPTIMDRASDIKRYFAGRANIVPTRIREPLFTADAMAKAVNQIRGDNIKDIIIDITTFTHEMLLILLKLLSAHKEVFSRVTCLYTGAREYSKGDPIKRKWLSKGCKEVRSVFGFPGQLVPGRSTCLIVLVGFEHERATRMIDEMDPERLLLGRGIQSNEHLTHVSHGPPMEYFHKLVNNMVSSRGDVASFEFSCRDHKQTVQSLISRIQGTHNYNHIIIPLNTKISTVAVALTALENPALQVCYAEPETYNFAAYSEPDDKATVFDIWSHDQVVSEDTND